ncbi:MAG: hypothetical protein S4CHLAM81_06740 [Chlamydiales bacterium]|nr:hypothetical protein [Chlamydiales bacterium]MCH9635458.1 hypothetical protein [Chlamydiales bacterium]MCH9703438.1 hypothetical protein [Chlamydiota bacterium]
MTLFLTLLVLLSGCQSQPHQPEERLYILHAPKAHITRDAIDPRTATLEMINVSDQVPFFTPTPKRVAGSITLSAFMMQWNTSANKQRRIPPNTAFLFFDLDGKQYDHEGIRLVQPDYDASTNSFRATIQATDRPFAFDKKEIEEVTLFLNLTL